MQPHAAERRHLERQVTMARPIFMVLALVELLELKQTANTHRAVVFVAVYLGIALLLVAVHSLRRGPDLRVPLEVDLFALAGFLVLTPSVVAFWFLYLFVAFAAGTRWGLRRAIILSAVVTLALLIRFAIHVPVNWPVILSWAALTVGTFAAGAGLAFLGARNRRHAYEHDFLARLTSSLQVDRGMAESLRLALQQLAVAFSCEFAVLALDRKSVV